MWKMCSRIAAKKCYCQEMYAKHYCEMADSEMLELKNNSDVTYLVDMYRHIKANLDKTQWEMMYDKCSIHLVDDGAAFIIDNRLP
jgi:hypothetical protein